MTNGSNPHDTLADTDGKKNKKVCFRPSVGET
jgi:hypothetical protein